MKKFFISILMMVLAVPSFAQFRSGGFSLNDESLYWGARFGITGASLSGDLDMGMKVGMTLGGVVGLRLSESTPVFLESGLYYTERGGKKNGTTIGYNNFEIPFLIKYGIQGTDEIAFLPFIGPYFSYAFSGKWKANGESGSTFRGDGLNHMNMGFKFGVGAEYNNLYLEVGYQLGVTNVSRVDNTSAHSNAIFANFGVNF